MYLSRVAHEDDEASGPHKGQAGCRPGDAGKAMTQVSWDASQVKRCGEVDTMNGAEGKPHGLYDVERR